jgi:RND family efflux transporter MFP subunit
VNKGDPIVTIETSPAGAAQYAQAASTLSFAQGDLAHTQRLYSEHLATKSQLATAEKVYSDARSAMVQQQKIGANHASDVLAAPAGGVVVSLGATPGEVVQPGTVIATIANRNHLSLDLGIEPADAPYVHPGANVSMRSRQDDNLNFTAQIVSIAAMVDSQSRLVNAVVHVPDEIAPRLLVGMTLVGRIDLTPHAGIMVPRSALLTDAEGTYVVAVRKGIAERRGVAVALETDKWALVARGLNPGDRIAIDGTTGVTSGMHVRTR